MGKLGTCVARSAAASEEMRTRGMELGRDNQDRRLGNKVWPCSMPACMHMHVCECFPWFCAFPTETLLLHFHPSWQRAVVGQPRVCSWLGLA